MLSRDDISKMAAARPGRHEMLFAIFGAKLPTMDNFTVVR